jgi:hypothetical protein
MIGNLDDGLNPLALAERIGSIRQVTAKWRVSRLCRGLLAIVSTGKQWSLFMADHFISIQRGERGLI